MLKAIWVLQLLSVNFYCQIILSLRECEVRVGFECWTRNAFRFQGMAGTSGKDVQVDDPYWKVAVAHPLDVVLRNLSQNIIRDPMSIHDSDVTCKSATILFFLLTI